MHKLSLRSTAVALAVACVLFIAGTQNGALSQESLIAASTINVNTTADENGTGPNCSLREAITTANTNANFGGCTGAAGGPFTVNVPAGTYSLTNGEIRIGTTAGTNISINGAGSATTIIRQAAATCTTAGNARVFNLDDNQVGNITVAITGVTISNGLGTSFGGGAILGGGNNDSLNLSNSVLSGNCQNAQNDGGAISWSVDGDLTISNTSFVGNSSLRGAGAVLYGAGLNAGSSHTLTITGSTFSGNTASGTNGGAILLIKQGSGGVPTFNINGNIFTGNSATGTNGGSGNGGAIYISSGILNLGNTSANVIVGNTATVGAAGGLSVHGGTVNAANNWWGCNAGPNSAGCDSSDNPVAATVTLAPWVVLSASASPNPIQVNQTSTLTADVLHNSSGGSLTPSQVTALVGRPVTWGSVTRGTLSNVQTSIQSNGTAAATFTASSAGSGGAGATMDNATVAASVTINKATTTSAITSDTPDPSAVGQPVTVNFHMASGTGSSPTSPTGSVTVTDGKDSCTGSINASGDGTCTITLTTAGSRPLTATYQGDANFSASPASAAAPHTVNGTTAASVSISGRVMDAAGSGLRGARVSIVDPSGNAFNVVTNSFGYYRFDLIRAGQSYTVTAAQRGFRFAAKLVSVNDQLSDLNFVAAP